MILTNKTYDITKGAVQKVLPGAGTLYFALAQIWGLPYGEQVVGTIAAITLFLGLMLEVSSRSYTAEGKDSQGTMYVDDSEEKTVYNLELDELPETLKDLDKVTFKVKHT